MERRDVNPWPWNRRAGWSQAVEMRGHERVLLVSGQVPKAPDGTTMHVGDLPAQVAAAMDNLDTVLAEVGMSLANVVRLNLYTTDIPVFGETAYAEIYRRLKAAGTRPACTVLGVVRLAGPDVMIEIEATAFA